MELNQDAYDPDSIVLLIIMITMRLLVVSLAEQKMSKPHDEENGASDSDSQVSYPLQGILRNSMLKGSRRMTSC